MKARYVGHERERLMGLELKESDIVNLGGLSAYMEGLLLTRIR